MVPLQSSLFMPWSMSLVAISAATGSLGAQRVTVVSRHHQWRHRCGSPRPGTVFLTVVKSACTLRTTFGDGVRVSGSELTLCPCLVYLRLCARLCLCNTFGTR